MEKAKEKDSRNMKGEAKLSEIFESVKKTVENARIDQW